MPKEKHNRPFVLIHVPRTGGSSAWHYLASLCKESHHVVDLNHEAQKRFGHERFALSAMSLYLGDLSRLEKPFLIHHHGVSPLTAMLPKARFNTIVRHPVHRLVGYFRHVQAQQSVGIETNEIEIGDLDIVEFYRQTPWHLVCYCAWFGAMMWESAGIYPREHLLDMIEPMPALVQAIRDEGDSFAQMLVEYMVNNFKNIGFFDQISPCVKMMARDLGIHSELSALPHVNMGRGTDDLEQHHSELAELCALDLSFYKHLRNAVSIWD